MATTPSHSLVQPDAVLEHDNKSPVERQQCEMGSVAFMAVCPPKTPEGIERIRRARLKHGRFSAQAKEERRRFRMLMKRCRELLDSIG